MRGANQSERSIGTRRGIGKLRRAVASNAITRDALDAQVQVLVEDRECGAEAEAAAGARVVRRSESAYGCGRRAAHRAGYLSRSGVWQPGRVGVIDVAADHAARINPVAEQADNTERFVMTEARIGGGLEDKVRRLVDGVAGGVKRVEKTAALTGCVQEEVAGGRRSGGRWFESRWGQRHC